MRIAYLNQSTFSKLIQLRHSILWLYNLYLRKAYGMKLHPSARISLKARMDKTNPKQLHVGEQSLVAFDAILLSHDYASRRHSGAYAIPTKVGKRCFIGCGSIIMPGVNVSDGCIVAAGSVVTKDVPENCIVGGNPAQILRKDIQTEAYGRLVEELVSEKTQASPSETVQETENHTTQAVS